MNQTADLWLDFEGAEKEFPPPPAETRAQTLPLHALTWESFERLCYRLAWRLGDVTDCRRYGVSGENQQGIDVYVRRTSDGRYATWQCKRYKAFSASNARKAVEGFLKSDWASKTAIFHLAVSASLSPIKLAKEIEKARKKCSAKGIEFVPLDEDKLSELLKEHPDLVDDFFGRPWVERFCGSEAAVTLSGRRLTRKQRVEARQLLRNLYTTHFASVDIGLPATMAAFRNAAKPLPLQDRYVIPSVEAVSSIVETVAAGTDPKSPPRDGIDANASGQQREHYARFPAFRVREHRTTLSLFDWLVAVNSGVLLGGPGLGKSAALRFLALDLLSVNPRNETLARKWGNYLPLFLPFAMLTRLVREREIVSMLDFLRGWLQKLSASPQTISLMEEALEDERLLLILDGLDEWTDQTSASTALTKILDFALPRKLPVVASSRRLGFERLGGLGPEWKQADLLPLNEEQQRAFTKIWFTHFHSAAPDRTGAAENAAAVVRDTDGFMAELEQDSALTSLGSIPLLLSTLIYLRLQGRVLPRNRYAALEEFIKSLMTEQPQRRAKSSLQGMGLPAQHTRLTERGVEFLALLVHENSDSDAIYTEKACEALAEFFQGPEFRKQQSDAVDLAQQQVERATHEVGILVQRDAGSIGFLHRSLQEFLAARQLARLPAPELSKLFVVRSGEPGWQEVLLAVLHLLKRPSEVDGLLDLVRRDETGSPLAKPLRQIFLARAAFGDLNCSASVAETIANEVFVLVESSPWMPFRRALLEIVVEGLDSEVVGEMVRQRLTQWFPGYHPYKSGLFKPLALKPGTHTGERLLIALFNTDSEHKDIAEAIAAGASAWPDMAPRLSAQLTKSGESELLAAFLHALALGWPLYAQLPGLLLQASRSNSSDLSAVALIHRAKRGDTSAEVKNALQAFCGRRGRVYKWRDEIVDALATNWPHDDELRSTALHSAREPRVPMEWDDRLALEFLIRAWPRDNEVAKTIADMVLREERAGFGLGMWINWSVLLSGFAGHPCIVPAAEAWLEKNAGPYREHDVAHVAMLGRSAKCRTILFAALQNRESFLAWPVEALIEIAGAADAELREVVATLMQDKARIGQIARYLPHFIEDRNSCEDMLLTILKEGKGLGVSSSLEGLKLIGRHATEKVMRLVEDRLKADADGVFWYATRSHLIAHFPQNPLVRSAALKEFGSEDVFSLGLLASAYGEDAEIRERVEKLLLPLHEDLRLALAKSLGPIANRGNEFARSLLSLYRFEPDAEARTSSAYAYYAAVHRFENNDDTHTNDLRREMTQTGIRFFERNQAALAGLVALKQLSVLREESLRQSKNRPSISIYSNGGPNWELLRLLVENWQELEQTLGADAWEMAGERHLLVREMRRAGKGYLIRNMPASLHVQARQGMQHSVDCFLEVAALEEGQDHVCDLCINIFEKYIRDNKHRGVSWGQNDIEVWIAAAHYLADHHAGDVKLGERLITIAKTSVEPTGPIIALCRGWPYSEFLSTLWDTLQGERILDSDPKTAWLVSLKADATRFADYIMSLPEVMQGDVWFSFPRETLRAVRLRLQKDIRVQELLLDAIKSNGNASIIGSVARLLGSTMTDQKGLASRLSAKLADLGQSKNVPEFAYDIVSGCYRPVEFCLLESYLTR